MKIFIKSLCALSISLCLFSLSHSQIDAEIDDLTLGCIKSMDELPLPDKRIVQIKRSCKNPMISHAKDLISEQDCSSHKILKRFYEISDDCRNKLSLIQHIYFTLEPDKLEDIYITISLGCNPVFPGAIPSPEVFTPPGCGETAKWKGDKRGNDGCNYWLERTFVIYTECGNSYLYIIQYTWKEDHDPPRIKCPKDIDLGCNPAAIPAPDPGQVIAEDHCCTPTVSWLTDVIVSNPSDCHQLRIRKYLAEDCCGNQAICEQKITWISDLTPPLIISCPPDQYLGCNPDYENLNDFLPKPEPDQVIASDECSKVTIRIENSDITVFNCDYSITRTYIVADGCGNESYCYQTFTWTIDEIRPVIEKCPADIDLGCNPEITDLGLQSPDYGIIASDNCGVAKIIRDNVSNVYETKCQKYYWIEYKVFDHCGNSASCRQKVSWTEDTQAPVINCPPDLIYCAPHHIPPVDLDAVTATDNCGVQDISMTASSISLIDGITLITRTFTATDFCDNQSSCDQTILLLGGQGSNDVIAVYDTLPPIDPFNFGQLCPGDVDFGCVSSFPDIPDPDLHFVNSPECDDFQVNHLGDDMLQINPCEYVLTRSYQIIDCCGNEGICYQQFEWRIVEDTTTEIPFPEDQVAFCQIPPVPDFAYQCGKYIPIYLGQTIVGDCDDGSCSIIRHWKAAVCGGVQLLHDQNIEVKCDITFDPGFSPGASPDEIDDLNIYPNPASEKIFLELGTRESSNRIEILNINGQVVKEIHPDSDRIEINIQDLTPGMYLVRSNGEKVRTKKFIKSQ
ncbi:MAG: T9SS type A sorting domain-containing protein [Saprospiraceae bacterium]|nr:T9SS type A sorting domain-containing protein [Saprospiraceae bacterium]